MPRDRDKVRRRLQEAALELFRDRGYDRTTAAGIAERAGVTERTFFRHFADKREVLFGGEATMGAIMVEAIRNAPVSYGPWKALLSALLAAEPLLAADRSLSRARRDVIAGNLPLQERELAKSLALNRTLAAALSERGVPEDTASLTAAIGMAALAQGFAAWLAEDGSNLSTCIDNVAREIHELMADPR